MVFVFTGRMFDMKTSSNVSKFWFWEGAPPKILKAMIKNVCIDKRDMFSSFMKPKTPSQPSTDANEQSFITPAFPMVSTVKKGMFRNKDFDPYIESCAQNQGFFKINPHDKGMYKILVKLVDGTYEMKLLYQFVQKGETKCAIFSIDNYSGTLSNIKKLPQFYEPLYSRFYQLYKRILGLIENKKLFEPFVHNGVEIQPVYEELYKPLEYMKSQLQDNEKIYVDIHLHMAEREMAAVFKRVYAISHTNALKSVCNYMLQNVLGNEDYIFEKYLSTKEPYNKYEYIPAIPRINPQKQMTTNKHYLSCCMVETFFDFFLKRIGLNNNETKPLSGEILLKTPLWFVFFIYSMTWLISWWSFSPMKETVSISKTKESQQIFFEVLQRDIAKYVSDNNLLQAHGITIDEFRSFFSHDNVNPDPKVFSFMVDKYNRFHPPKTQQQGGKNKRSKLKKTKTKVTTSRGVRCVYEGVRGGKYIKMTGMFVSYNPKKTY
jgi:hypothetical protein